MVVAGLFVLCGALMAGGLRALRDPDRTGRAAVTLAAVLLAFGVPVLIGSPASADIVASVPLGTTSSFSVLAATTVTNTGNTTLARNLGLSPGSSVTGFPPGTVTPPATMEVANAVAVQAQSDLTTAYNNAAGRPMGATTGADLAGLTLQGGVYGATSTKAPLGLTGTVTLDGANNSDSVWIFQTDSTLITGSSSTIALINGALACNVFWQVGSSATLGAGTTFVGTILAQTSISLGNAVTVDGRALARTGAVTLIDDTFTGPGCTPPPTTTTAPTTTIPGVTTTAAPTTTTPGVTTTVAPTTTVTGATTTVPGVTTTIPGVTTTVPGVTTTIPGVTTTVAPTTTIPGATTTIVPTTVAGPTTTAAPTTTALAATTTTTARVSSTTIAGARGTTTTIQGAAGGVTTTTTTGDTVANRLATSTTRALGATVTTGGAATSTTVLVAIPRTGSAHLAAKLLLAAVAYAAGASALLLADRRRKAAAA